MNAVARLYDRCIATPYNLALASLDEQGIDTTFSAPRNWFKLELEVKILDVKVEAFQLKPELYVRLEVTDVTPA
ncbi:MAG: hypothetical protein JST12_17135 [Armatimonadetes bacterium]|nr:hypothetical protein [Armatimonadota bacterium]